ncbi:MAG TPA: flagellar biosynthetic protein FliR [Balneolales bacterium]|nr:flagellar biosynthetic protein FliR [Balneolales bacterium]
MNIFSVEFILASFLIFVRVSSLIFSAPYFSSAVFPQRIKLFFAFAVTIVLYPIIPLQGAVLATDATIIQVVIAILKEVLVGLSMGLVGQIIFGGVQMAGQLVSYDLGISFGSIVDPVTSQQNGVLPQFMTLLAILLFLGIRGDALYIKALAASFSIVPIGHVYPAEAAPVFLKMAVYLFKIGVQLASPFLVVLFLMDLSFAIFARIMPQSNIFFIALPLKLGVGILVFLIVLPYLPVAFNTFFNHLWNYLSIVLHSIGK